MCNKPFCVSSIKALRAKEPRTFRRSETTEGVINLYWGTSLYSLSYVALSNNTWLFNLSRTFPLDHFCRKEGIYKLSTCETQENIPSS